MASRALLLVAAAGLALGCEKTTTSVESLGAVEIQLVTPHEDDRAILLNLTGPLREVRAAAGFTAYVQAAGAGGTTVVLVRDGGGSIPTGGIAVALVAPEESDTRHSVDLDQVAARDHSLRDSFEGYSIRVIAGE